MTKLVRKLKQMTKKRAHRKTVQKRKVERAQRELERRSEQQSQKLEDEVDREMARLNGEIEEEVNARAAASSRDIDNDAARSVMVKRAMRIVGDLILDTPVKKSKKQLTRKQARRREKMVERGLAVSDSLSNKWDRKKRCVKIRAQIRNEDLHN
ncbi:putative Alb1 [Leishmania utingensis]|uniref:Alb1 n=1 Tax=Leishmania utingensis TaxID=653362 RepID=A0AAW2ZXN9_9TRYP